jgi:hypothetical protein
MSIGQFVPMSQLIKDALGAGIGRDGKEINWFILGHCG